MCPRVSRLLGGFTAIALLLLVAAACNRPAQPSEDFTDAHSRFSKLYGKSGDDAFLDPEMARIEAQLRLVPHDSLDADSARELIERIKKGRAEALKRSRELEQAAANATGQPSTSFALPETDPSDRARRAERAEALPDRMPPPPREPEPPAVDGSDSPPPPQVIDSPAPPQDKESENAQAQIAEARARKEAELAEQKAKEEAMWRGRFQQANSQVTELQAQLKAKERERQLNVQGVTMFMPNDCNPAERICPPATYEDKEASLRNAIQDLKTRLSQAESDLAELERQASSQSVPREWRR